MLSVISSFLPQAKKPLTEEGCSSPAKRNLCPRLLLSLLFIASCSAPQQDVEIPFEIRFGERSLSCTGDIDGVALTDLRFYVYDIRLVTADNDEHRLTLIDDPLWQSAEVALLDFESGEERCTNGTEQTNDIIRGRVPRSDYTGLKFRIGVPEHLNHADPLRADAPLSYSFMHWHWLTGYKFLRAGLAGENDGFWMHLGSARCERTAGNATGCRSGNRPAVVLSPYVPGKDVVQLDLQALVDGIDLEDGTPSDCSSGPSETECRMPFIALGIDFSSGDAVAAPTVFRVGQRE
jgi:uncharacterized repeat protein (TIGR04052 family)